MLRARGKQIKKGLVPSPPPRGLLSLPGYYCYAFIASWDTAGFLAATKVRFSNPVRPPGKFYSQKGLFGVFTSSTNTDYPVGQVLVCALERRVNERDTALHHEHTKGPRKTGLLRRCIRQPRLP